MPKPVPKYEQVVFELSADIRAGKYEPGQKLPSEAALVQRFKTSRITIGRALRELKQRGVLKGVAGSGNFVRAAPKSQQLLTFGLLIPNLGETEIFEPICQGMASAQAAGPHALIWGNTSGAHGGLEEQALQLCDQYIARSVTGVFFAPLEMTPRKNEVNRQIAARLTKANIPVVLLDRCILPFPHRSPYDLVGIDNRRAGYLAAEHLLQAGSRNIAFLAVEGAAPTVEARIAGFREALFAHGVQNFAHAVQRLDSFSPADVRLTIERSGADSFVCANDRIAGQLLLALQELGFRVPADLRVVGIDDVEYASLLPVPLTTVHQPCREIGEAAIAVMLGRREKPGMLARDVLLDCRLVVRKSSGVG